MVGSTPPPVLEEDDRGEVGVIQQLRHVSTVGYSGGEVNCLQLLPSPERMIHPLGSTVVVRETAGGGQSLAVGHRYPVSCLALSSSRRYLVTGDRHKLGYRATVIVWDAGSGGWQEVGSHDTHHGAVAAVGVSPDDARVVSLGGEDDKTIVVWDMETRRPVCSQVMNNGRSGLASCMLFLAPDRFLVGGQDRLQCWTMTGGDKLTQVTTGLAKMKRNLKVMTLDRSKDVAYCGTTSGDVLKVALNSGAPSGGPALVAALVRKTKKGAPPNTGRCGISYATVLRIFHFR